MQRLWNHRRLDVLVAFCLAVGVAGQVLAMDRSKRDTADKLWREGVHFVSEGEFSQAAEAFRAIPQNERVTKQVRTWLNEYLEKEKTRKELDRADLEKYVGYAKARIERKEYAKALNWALLAADCARDREAFLQDDWLHDLVDKSLTVAEKNRKQQKWQEAWVYYSRLGDLFEREPRYKKLERQVLTLWRLDTMFEDDNKWDEHIEKVRWEDAERALECIELYYVESPDFKAIAEGGLEQMLLLAESKSARQHFEGLKNDDDRRDFELRVRARLERIRSAPSLTRSNVSQHFRRVVKDINSATARLPQELIVSELMRGALEPLDDFTTIIWPQDSEEFDKHTRGDFIGVGISIVKNRLTDEIEVVTPLEDAPAYRAGIQAGDIISHVDGKSIKGMSLTKVVHTITGPVDSEVVLTIRRDGKDFVFPLTRQRVKIQSVKGLRRDPNNEERWLHWLDKENGIAYIRVTNFQKNTVEDVANVLSELAAHNLRGLLLDLRGNPGGLLDSAWKMSSLFLQRGDNVVSTRGRDRTENQRLNTPGRGPWADLPLVLLVDESSASASEIVAGSIQDNHHGIVIGARTFGKFSVQNLIQLSRTNAKIKITTARYYLPSGRSLHRQITSRTWGVEPNIHDRLVRWERVNLWKGRRETDRLGPPKPEVASSDNEDAKTATGSSSPADQGNAQSSGTTGNKDAQDENANSPKDGDDAAHQEDDATKGKDTQPTDAEEEENKLPPLEQPDENDRPMADPQLDTALLVMRVKLLGDLYPTLAAADTHEEADTAKP